MTFPSTQREFARTVVEQLRGAGHEALWAGGCVRDQLLGREPKDYDVATSALPDAVRSLFGHRQTLAVGAAFGVITVLGRKPLEPIEVATFRTDGNYRDGRRPESVAFTDAEHDAQRRDFTMNGLFYDPVEDRVVDYVGGVADLEARIVRAIGDPRLRFGEDKLRLLRAVRFAATYEFEIHPMTREAMREMAPQVTVVSGERVGAEMRRMLAHPTRRRAVELLAESLLLGRLAAPLAPHAAARDAAWSAALTRLDRLQSCEFPTALAALLFGMVNDVQIKALGRALRLSNREVDRAAWLNQRLGDMLEAATLPWPRLQRLLAHEAGAELLALAAASLPDGDAGLARCRAELARPASQWNPPPLVTGDQLIAHGLQAGPHFSELLDYLRDQQLLGRLTTQDQALRAAERWVRERSAE